MESFTLKRVLPLVPSDSFSHDRCKFFVLVLLLFQFEPRVLDGFSSGDPFVRVFFEQFGDEVFAFPRHALKLNVIEVVGLVLNFIKNDILSFALEGEIARDERIEDDSDRP